MKNVQFIHKKYRKNVRIIVKSSAIGSRAKRRIYGTNNKPMVDIEGLTNENTNENKIKSTS